MDEVLRVVWHHLDDSNGNKTHSLLPLALMPKAGSSTSADLQGSPHRANAEMEAQGVAQIPEYAYRTDEACWSTLSQTTV